MISLKIIYPRFLTIKHYLNSKQLQLVHFFSCMKHFAWIGKFYFSHTLFINKLSFHKFETFNSLIIGVEYTLLHWQVSSFKFLTKLMITIQCGEQNLSLKTNNNNNNNKKNNSFRNATVYTSWNFIWYRKKSDQLFPNHKQKCTVIRIYLKVNYLAKDLCCEMGGLT
jgi:hypothetical protein